MRKLLIVALAVVAASAQAETFAYVQSKKNGAVLYLLSDRNGCNARTYQFVAVSPGNTVDTGCWVNSTEGVIIKWPDGEIRTYPSESFTIHPDWKGPARGPSH